MKHTKKNRYLRKEKYTPKTVPEHKRSTRIILTGIPSVLRFRNTSLEMALNMPGRSAYIRPTAAHEEVVWSRSFVYEIEELHGTHIKVVTLFGSWQDDCAETIFERRYVWDKMGKQISQNTRLR